MQALESDILLAAKQYLNIGYSRGDLYFDRLNSGRILVKTGKSQRMIDLCREGTPDLFILQDGEWKFIECKRKGKELSPAQKEIHSRLKDQGAKVYVCDDVDAIIDIIGLDRYLKGKG